VYLTFKPRTQDSIEVAVAIKSKRDRESFRRVRGILGHRMILADTFVVRAVIGETLIAKDGGWKYNALYGALNAVVPAELIIRDSCPEWLRRILSASSSPLHFMDYRMGRVFDESWPYAAMRVAARYYEATWPKPVAP
jgi:hypothetical protein